MSNYVDQINKAIESIVSSHVEYEETHDDAGNNYSHLPMEGGWCYNNCNDKVKAFLEVNEIDCCGLDLEEVNELVINNFEMVSGHIFGCSKDDILVIDSYPLTEIETQIELSVLSELSGLNITKNRIEAIKENSREHCINSIDNETFCVYAASDVVWSAQINAERLQELINDTER